MDAIFKSDKILESRQLSTIILAKKKFKLHPGIQIKCEGEWKRGAEKRNGTKRNQSQEIKT